MSDENTQSGAKITLPYRTWGLDHDGSSYTDYDDALRTAVYRYFISVLRHSECPSFLPEGGIERIASVLVADWRGIYSELGRALEHRDREGL